MTRDTTKARHAMEWVVGGVTAITSTVAAALLVAFLTVIQTLYEQAPLVTAHMAVTNQKLASIEAEQALQSKSMAVLLKDYTSRDQLQLELEKVSEKIRVLQLQLALLQQKILKQGEDRS